jgi:hypothetical protein
MFPLGHANQLVALVSPPTRFPARRLQPALISRAEFHWLSRSRTVDRPPTALVEYGGSPPRRDVSGRRYSRSRQCVSKLGRFGPPLALGLPQFDTGDSGIRERLGIARAAVFTIGDDAQADRFLRAYNVPNGVVLPRAELDRVHRPALDFARAVIKQSGRSKLPTWSARAPQTSFVAMDYT